MAISVYNGVVVWSGTRIGIIKANVARLDFSMKVFVKYGLKFHQAYDIMSNFDKIIETLTMKGYQVEIERTPENSLVAVKSSYDTWHKMIYG